LLIPLSIQQSKSAEYMKALKPYTAQIKERFKNNEDAQNRALGKLYEDANQNPLSGCLLSLAQIPIFLGLYRGVRLLAMDGKLEEPFLWIPSLEGPVSGPDYRGLDWLLQGWTPADVSGGGGPLPFVPSMGWETTLAFLVMPVILVLLQSVTMQVLQPPVDDAASEEEKKTLESTQGVIKFLPLLIGFFSLQVPAGLTIYWFASNIFTLTQSLTVRAYFAANPPNITLPEYWDKASEVAEKDFADLTPEERRQATEMGIKIGPTMEDLIDEGRFHVFIERPPLRQSTAAWERLVAVDDKTNDSGIFASTNVEIPEALQHWVALKMDDLATKTHNIDETKPEHKDEKPDMVITTSSESSQKSEAAAATNTSTVMQA
jgi:YidC/Oxa1 family membrane protein insertase